jgi:putative addiction module CopG family antidote
MNIAVTERHKRFIAGKVKSGAYASAQEVIRDGLRLLEAEDERRQRIAWLQTEIEKGFAGAATPWSRKDSDRVRGLIAAQGKGKR